MGRKHLLDCTRHVLMGRQMTLGCFKARSRRQAAKPFKASVQCVWVKILQMCKYQELTGLPGVIERSTEVDMELW